MVITFCLFSLLISNAQLSFTKGDTPLGTEPGKCTTSGDIDSDGDIDIIIGYAKYYDLINEVVDGSDTNQIWLNQGDGSFILSEQFIGTGGVFAKLVDLNNDNMLDLVFANKGSDYSIDSGWSKKANAVWINEGEGIFTNYNQQIDSGAQFIQIIDFDNNESPDLNLGKSIWLNDGTGGFTNLGISIGGDDIRNFTLGDLNHDGYCDAYGVVDDYINGAPGQIFFNDGSDNFIQDNTQNIGNSNSAVAILEDLNGDNYPDVFLANHLLFNGSGGNDEVWFNKGNGILTKGNFSMNRINTADAKIIDMDNDGDMDIFTNYEKTEGISPVQVAQYFWLNNGDGDFSMTDVGIVSLPGFDINDFNGDGKPDILVVTSTGNYIWFNTTISNITFDKIHDIKIYPNPTQNTLQIEYPGLIRKSVSYTIINISGRIVQHGKLTYNSIDVSKLIEGPYILKIKIDDQIVSRKFILQ